MKDLKEIEDTLIEMLPSFIENTGSLHKVEDYYFFIVTIPKGRSSNTQIS